MKRLAIVSTHPIQYNAPMFRLIAAAPEIDLKVFYSKVTEEIRFDRDFGQEVTWDISLTDGYEYESFSAASSLGRKKLIQAIEDFQPNALLVYGWNFDGHFAVMERFHGKVPVWFRGDSTILDPLPLWKTALRKAWLTWVYRKIDKAFYVGAANKRYFEWARVKENNLIYAPHAVDNEFFQADDLHRRQQAREIRNNLGIAEEAFVILFVGKLEPNKQPLELARAFKRFLEQEPGRSVHLVFVGSGALFNQIEIEGRNCPNVHLVGFVNQSLMPTYYRIGNCLCLPSSQTETWGLAANEFLASTEGILILSDRVGCAEDIISASDTLLPWSDYNAWPSKFLEAVESYSKLHAPPKDPRNLGNFHQFLEAITLEISKL